MKKTKYTIILILFVITLLAFYSMNKPVDKGTNKEIILPLELEKNDSVDQATMVILLPVGTYGDLSLQEFNVEKKPAVLDSSFKKLFSLNKSRNGSYNGLEFESISLSDSIARLDLSGTWYPLGDISGAEMKEKFRATAFQFDTVDSLEVYVNGEIFDWCIDDQSDGEAGCPENKKLWIEKK